jgi:Transglycosylase SLT domain/D-alanyl-D-alanine carboxypeptidase
MIGFIDGTLLPKFTQLKDWIAGIFQSISDTASAIWGGIGDIITTALNFIIDRINDMIGGINTFGDWIEKLPGDFKVGDIDKIPNVGGKNGSGKGSGSRRAGNSPSFHAAGGMINPRLSGPFMTNGPRAIVGEGDRRYPEFVIPTDPKFRGNALKYWQQAGASLFAKGGVLPRGPGIAGLYDPLASIVQRIVSESRGQVFVRSGWRDTNKQAQLYAAFKAGRGNPAAPPGSSNHERGAAVDFGGSLGLWRSLAAKYGLIFPVKGENWHAEHPSQSGRGGLLGRATQIIYSNMFEQFSPLARLVKGMLPRDTAFAGAGHGLADAALQGLLTSDSVINSMFAAQDPGAGDSGGGTGAGVERWRSVALEALRMAGQPASFVGDLLRQMQHESGGNPRAINNWDSNARKGTPSMGLMQTILSTFNAHAGHLVGRGVYDPLANVYAAIRYTLSRYGDLGAWRRRGFKGYANGAIFRGPRNILAGEDGPEVLLPLTRPARARQLAAQSGLYDVIGSPNGSRVTVNVQPGAVVVQLPPGVTAREAALIEAQAGKAFLDVIQKRQALADARLG